MLTKLKSKSLQIKQRLAAENIMRLVIESKKKKIIEGQLKIYQTLNVKPETSSEKRA